MGWTPPHLRGVLRLTLWSYYETSATVKLLMPPQQSWGISIFSWKNYMSFLLSQCVVVSCDPQKFMQPSLPSHIHGVIRPAPGGLQS